MDTTLLRLLEHSPDELYYDKDCVYDILWWEYNFKFMLKSHSNNITLNSCVEELMELKNTKKLCLSLKMLKIVLSRNNKAIKDEMQSFYHSKLNCFDALFGNTWEHFIIGNSCFFWVLKLQNIPEARHPQQKRISSWLRDQCNNE